MGRGLGGAGSGGAPRVRAGETRMGCPRPSCRKHPFKLYKAQFLHSPTAAPPASGQDWGQERKYHSRVGPVGLDFHGGRVHPPVPRSQGETGEGACPGGGWGPGQLPTWLFLATCHFPLTLSFLICKMGEIMTLPGRVEGRRRAQWGPTVHSVSYLLCLSTASVERAVPGHRWRDRGPQRGGVPLPSLIVSLPQERSPTLPLSG